LLLEKRRSGGEKAGEEKGDRRPFHRKRVATQKVTGSSVSWEGQKAVRRQPAEKKKRSGSLRGTSSPSGTTFRGAWARASRVPVSDRRREGGGRRFKSKTKKKEGGEKNKKKEKKIKKERDSSKQDRHNTENKSINRQQGFCTTTAKAIRQKKLLAGKSTREEDCGGTKSSSKRT